MKGKRYFSIYLRCVFLLVFGISILNYWLDPLQFYRPAESYEPRYLTNARFQMPGLIKHMEYDTIMIGTSMSQNFSEEYMNQRWKTKTWNAAISGASSKEQSLALELALQTGKVQHVYWEINFDSLFGDVDRVRDEYGDFPYYLYDGRWWTDIQYLFNFYPIKEAVITWTANWLGDQHNRDPYQVYKFGQGRPALTREVAQEILSAEGSSPTTLLSYDHSYENMLQHVQENILPIIKAYPDVSFTFYFPPFSILYWKEVEQRHPQILANRLQLKEELIRQMLSMGNVQVRDFQAEKEITYDLSKYMDTSHYFSTVNDYLVDELAKQSSDQSLPELLSKIKLLKEQIEKVTIDQIKS